MVDLAKCVGSSVKTVIVLCPDCATVVSEFVLGKEISIRDHPDITLCRCGRFLRWDDVNKRYQVMNGAQITEMIAN